MDQQDHDEIVNKPAQVLVAIKLDRMSIQGRGRFWDRETVVLGKSAHAVTKSNSS